MTATTLETRQRPWWLLLIGGIIAIVVGAVLLWAPTKTAANAWLVLISLLGVYWLLTGVLDLVHMFQDHTAWGWKLFTGLISIIAGGYILLYPIASAVALPRIFVLVLGIWGLLQGLVMLLMAFRGAGFAAGILGVLGIIFGIALIGNYALPGMGLAFIWMTSVGALIGGVLLVIQAFRQRRTT